jgi:iduronate 2-sulfatase
MYMIIIKRRPKLEASPKSIPRVRVWLHAILIVLVQASCSGESHAEQKPHVLFISIDDLRDWTIEFGGVRAQTPNLDRLAASGVHFRRAYCQIPLCNPSRASLMTGLRPDQTGVFDLDLHFRTQLPGVVTLPQHFRQHGYRATRVGKIYHYDVPRGIGTDGLDDRESWDHVVNPRGRDVDDEDEIVNPTPERPISAALSWLAAEGSDEEQTDGMIASEAIKLLREHRDGPIFLGVGFFRPHTPFVAPKAYFDLYPLEKISLPLAPEDDREDIPVAAFAHNNPIPHYGLDAHTCREAIRAYLACTSFVDAQVGRLLDALDELNLTEQTIVVLWSDHGYHLGEHLGIWQKRTLFEESARAPLIIRDPRLMGLSKPQSVCDRVVEFVDIYPTLAELCGLPIDQSLAGKSLRPLLIEPTQRWDSCAVTQVLRPADARLPRPIMGRSIRTQRWRYTQWDEGRDGEELYDHNDDPDEFNNLAETPAAQPVIGELRMQLQQRAAGVAPPASTYNPARL